MTHPARCSRLAIGVWCSLIITTPHHIQTAPEKGRRIAQDRRSGRRRRGLRLEVIRLTSTGRVWTSRQTRAVWESGSTLRNAGACYRVRVACRSGPAGPMGTMPGGSRSAPPRTPPGFTFGFFLYSGRTGSLRSVRRCSPLRGSGIRNVATICLVRYTPGERSSKRP